MEIYKIILYFIELRETNALNKKIIKSDLDIFLKQTKLKIILSLLLKENFLLSDDNDEIVLELSIERETLNGTIDITDSKGNYYLKETTINIHEEYIKYLAKIINHSIDKISKI
ncbi:Uncharacterised protein [Kingella potus]|uniref:Uncharacterized protein n=1 Tax=Kingella potus TaxID=265175 RepID=A0A377R0H4_9NEIS|nr:hypothetical protein [Kingella potus]UOP01369.1 hypothetical protein LVJ84_03805 [Kingella potus]STR00318.1 Uncharacterised protein [Kingella potus]